MDHNPDFLTAVELRDQPDSKNIFENIIDGEERFTFSMCNPPFHDSEEAASKGNLRKTKNLNKKHIRKPLLNFGGKPSELWCEGGELAFITNMIHESVSYSSQILWFTCLVSKKDNLFKLTSLLKKLKAVEFKIIDMAQGQKTSRILSWTFISPYHRKDWSL